MTAAVAWGDQIVAHLPQLQRFAFSLCRNHDRAGDLVQDTVERALKKEPLYEAGTNLRAWLFTMMRNHWIADGRKAMLRACVDIDHPGLALPALPASQDRIADAKRILEALPYLRPEEREPVLMMAEGMSYEEIAASLRIPVGTAKSRISRGRDQLQSLMAGGLALMKCVEGGDDD